MTPGGGLGLLFSLPMDSIAVRTILASVAAVALGRVLLQRGLVRVPRLRALVALLPGLALAAVLLGFAADPELPGLWLPVDVSGEVSVRVADTYLSFSPVAAATLLGAWAAVVALRVAVRLVRQRRATRTAAAAVAAAHAPPPALVATVSRLAGRMGTVAPRVAVLPHLPGGAVVLGVRQPVLGIDATLLASLDAHEIEGVVAHELAHVARQDNLVAAVLGIVRDAFFFVPGGAWSLTRLLREREHAADTAAVAVTGRPGALASGLLKVLEGARAPAACAPLMPEGTLVERVRVLCDDRPAPTRTRVTVEAAATLASVGLAVVAAVTVPGLLMGADGQRDALGVLVSGVAGQQDGEGGSATAFRVYREVGAAATTTASTPPVTDAPVLDDPAAWTPRRLEACGAGQVGCAAERPRVPTLPLRPPTVVEVEDDRVARWRLDPVFASDDRELALFWFQRLQ